MPKPTWCGLSAHEKTHHLYMVGFNMQKKKDMHNGKNVSSEKGVMVEPKGIQTGDLYNANVARYRSMRNSAPKRETWIL